jgi:hypothetical protein
VLATWDIRSKIRGESNVENLAHYVDKEGKTWVELIIRAHLLERIAQIANTGLFSLPHPEKFGTIHVSRIIPPLSYYTAIYCLCLL